MPINDAAVLAISTGHFYTAPTGTARPADLRAPGVGWTEMGHTSLEDILSAESEGGDVTTLGTLQNKTLRTSRSARTESFAMVLQQFDVAGSKLFYGSNCIELPNGDLGVPSDPRPTTCAWLAVMYDGDESFAVYAPRAEIYRGDNFELGDTESLSSLPLAVTPLQHGANAYTYTVTPLGEGDDED